jgi:23S rRNA (adenine2030-N6)-methyltransferase
MKYRHAYHAGNFADVHKHIALLALLAALKRKDKGFFHLETHAGRGAYDLTGEAAREARLGIERFIAAPHRAEELLQYSNAVAAFRDGQGSRHAYPGSPLLAADALRAQDRAVFVEIVPAEAGALERALGAQPRMRVEIEDGFTRLRAHLPPQERRGLTFIDPPYEETREDFGRVQKGIAEALQRFATGVIAAWYPIKEERDTAAWHASLATTLNCEAVVSELWLYPRDSRVALNGSGLLIVNPPYQLAERMGVWLPELLAQLDAGNTGGWNVRPLSSLAR